MTKLIANNLKNRISISNCCFKWDSKWPDMHKRAKLAMDGHNHGRYLTVSRLGSNLGT